MGLSTDHNTRQTPWRWLTSLAGALAWVNWPTWTELARRWSVDPRYSHGFLVPAFSLYLLWSRRGLDPLATSTSSGASWWGVALLAAGAGVRLAGVRFYLGWFEAAGLLPSLAGLALLVGGNRGLVRAWPSIAFLAFMIPLPYRVEVALGRPLQHGAALCSTWALQMAGLAATSEGNVINLGRSRIGVVEACNGLGMLFTFASLATAAALVSRRPAVDRLVIVLSALPIAFVANVTRITATGWLHEVAGGRVADLVYHDLAGWLMMPLALLLLWTEARLLTCLLAVQEVGNSSISNFKSQISNLKFQISNFKS